MRPASARRWDTWTAAVGLAASAAAGRGFAVEAAVRALVEEGEDGSAAAAGDDVLVAELEEPDKGRLGRRNRGEGRIALLR
ncbi:hypothetical protein IEQ34_002040 [Dendrobium chrysotoxum]|uniref:Secreted protein n=1 Tax=Dendrobium chrysotoxum TaxID=161865 RepID=A0AAV7HL01_DENCH|nr:hypothetical protein IEQ34_002040 [Dendrobium chrysotoxum]